MKYRWWMPGIAAVFFFVMMNLAKDSTPWPIYLGLVVLFLGSAGLTMLLHSQDRASRR